MILSHKRHPSFRKPYGAAILLTALLPLFGAAIPMHAHAPKGDLPPHQATLTWTAGTNTTGSNACRCPGTCSLTSGTFAVLNSAPITATTYVDTGVVAILRTPGA